MDFTQDELDTILKELEETIESKEFTEILLMKDLPSVIEFEKFFYSDSKQGHIDVTMMELSEGFDAKHMVSLLWKKFQKMKADKELKFEVYSMYKKCTLCKGKTLRDDCFEPAEGATIIFSWVPGQGFLRDMYILCTLFAIRGSNWQKAWQRMNVGCSHLIYRLAIGYALKNMGDATLEKSDITLPRIAACFPNLMAMIFHRNQGLPLYPKAELGFEETISSAVLAPYIISCIPKAWRKNADVMATFFLAYILKDIVINTSTNKLTSISRLLVYFNKAMNSVVMSDKLREETMKYCNLNVTSFDGKLQHALEKVKRLRPNDPHLNTILLRLHLIS